MNGLDLRTYPGAVIGWRVMEEGEKPEPVASIIWTPSPAGWFVENLRVNEVPDGLPLFLLFRRCWREAGRPVITFRSSEETGERRLPRLFDAPEANGSCRLDNLDRVKLRGRLANTRKD